jgi:serine/threonine-protein kinase
MSPEQCKGGVEVSDRADVYSLGVILYRLLAGRLPFVATGGGELLGMHQFQQPTPLSSLASYLPASVVDLIQVTIRASVRCSPRWRALFSRRCRRWRPIPVSPTMMSTKRRRLTRRR